MAIGEFVLFFCGHFYDNAALAMPLFYTGLGCMIAGNGFFKQKTAYEISACLVGSEMCIRDRSCF